MTPSSSRPERASALALSMRARWNVLLAGSVTASGVAAVMGFVLGNALDATQVSLDAIQNLASAFYALFPIAITHAVLTTLVDRAAARGAGVPLANPWVAGLGCALGLGVPAALFARPIVSALCPLGAAPMTVALLLAAGALPLAASVIAVVTSDAFTCALRRPPASSPEAVPAYLLARHVVPVGLFNVAVNLAAAFALFPGSIAPVELVASDAAATFALIALFVGTGTVTHARGDVRSGLVRPLAREAASPAWRSVALLAAVTLGCAGATWLALELSGVPGLSLLELALWRGLAFGAFAALVACLAARWTLQRGPRPPRHSEQLAAGAVGHDSGLARGSARTDWAAGGRECTVAPDVHDGRCADRAAGTDELDERLAARGES